MNKHLQIPDVKGAFRRESRTCVFSAWRFTQVLISCLSIALLPLTVEAKSYSSGGGKSYSSSSSSSRSSSSGSGGSRSTSSGGSPSKSSPSAGGGSSRSSSPGGNSGSSKNFSSSSGKSYSSGDNSSKGYSAGKSYSSGSGRTFSPKPDGSPSSSAAKKSSSPSTSSGFSFDTPAARAKKEAESKRTYSSYQESQIPRPTTPDINSKSSGAPPEIPRSRFPETIRNRTYPQDYRRQTFNPNPETYATRRIRIEHVYAPYYSRPTVVYRDNYNSLFWWWMLDRSLDDRATWAYHHSYDMDTSRFQNLLAHDAELAARIRQLEEQQVATNPNYVPPGIDPDLMYTDQHFNRVYSNRPTASGQIAFWLLLIPTGIGTAWLLGWLIFFKRWQTAR